MDEGARKAGDKLWGLWKSGSCIEILAEDCRPDDLEAGYRAQAALVNASGQKPVGYKIAASSRAGQAHLKITHPVYGRLLESQMVDDSGEALWRDHAMSVAELEFAFQMGRDLVPRDEPYEWREVMDAVDAMHIGIELPGSRFFDAAEAGIAQIVADNASAYLYVQGPKAEDGWREVDLAQCKARMLVDGEVVADGIGADALGDPRFSLTWLANTLSDQGFVLEKGQLVTTGVCGMPVPVRQGQHVVGDFDKFGMVEVRLI